MLSKLKSGWKWLSSKVRGGSQRAHTTLEGWEGAQATFVFLFKNISLLLKLIPKDEDDSNTHLKYLCIALAPALIITALSGYGAFQCHKANDIGNSDKVTNTIKKALKVAPDTTGKIIFALQNAKVSIKRKLSCLGEITAHSLGAPGIADEFFTTLSAVLKKFSVIYDPSLEVQVGTSVFFFLVGLWGSITEVGNAVKGWEQWDTYNEIQKNEMIKNKIKEMENPEQENKDDNLEEQSNNASNENLSENIIDTDYHSLSSRNA